MLVRSLRNMGGFWRFTTFRMEYSALILVLIMQCFVSVARASPPPLNSAVPATTRSSNVKMLTEANWQAVLKGDEEWLIMFKADWCPACKQFKPAFETACGKQTDSTPRFGCAIVDVDASPGLAGRFQANMLPTVYHVKRGEYRKYPGFMNQKGLEDFVYDMQWQAATPVPKYFSPGSPHMRIIQEFYMLSGRALRVHDYFVKVHKLPPWTVYGIFVLAVILGGFFIGLGFVFVVDGLGWLLGRRQEKAVGQQQTRRRDDAVKNGGGKRRIKTEEKVDAEPQPTPSTSTTPEAKPTASRPSSKPASRAASLREEPVKLPVKSGKSRREDFAEGTLAEEVEREDLSASSATDTNDDDEVANMSSDAGQEEIAVNGKHDVTNGDVSVDTEEDTAEPAPPTKPRKQRNNDISVNSAGDTASTISGVTGSEHAGSENNYNLRPRLRRRREE